MIHGNAWDKKLEYAFAATNGSGLNKINGNNEFLYTGRLTWNPLGNYGYVESDIENSEHPALTIAANGGYNVEDETDKKVFLAGGNIGFKYRGFSFQGEGFMRNNNPTGANNSSRDYGYYAQAGYFVIPKHLELAGRASQVFLDGPSNNKAEYTAAINYFFFGHDLKIQADYSFLPTQTVAKTEKDHRVRLQLQAWF